MKNLGIILIFIFVISHFSFSASQSYRWRTYLPKIHPYQYLEFKRKQDIVVMKFKLKEETLLGSLGSILSASFLQMQMISTLRKQGFSEEDIRFDPIVGDADGFCRWIKVYLKEPLERNRFNEILFELIKSFFEEGREKKWLKEMNRSYGQFFQTESWFKKIIRKYLFRRN